jgi:hemoglobin
MKATNENPWLYVQRHSIPATLRSLIFLAPVVGMLMGCGSSSGEKQNDPFFTSGSREADQRASQRMAKAEQLAGSDSEKEKPSGDQNAAQKVPEKLSLYERLGGEPGLAALVDDFTPRLLQDPRVNWKRESVKKPGLLSRGPAVTWNPTSENVATLKKHMVQFLSLATGGPARYEGKEMRASHSTMQITNAEFDAAVGDIKASLDKLKIPNQEQKELLAIFESTRPQIVTER